MIIKKLGICQKPRTKMWARIVPVTPKTRICKAPKTRICKASDRTESKMGGGEPKTKNQKKPRVQSTLLSLSLNPISLCGQILLLFFLQKSFTCSSVNMVGRSSPVEATIVYTVPTAG